MRFLLSSCLLTLAACAPGGGPPSGDPSGPCGPDQIQEPAPIPGGKVLDSGQFDSELVVDATHVYWVRHGRLRAIAIDGGALADLGPDTIEQSIADDEQSIFAASVAADASIHI